MKRLLVLFIFLPAFISGCDFLITEYELLESEKEIQFDPELFTLATFFDGDGLYINVMKTMHPVSSLHEDIDEARVTIKLSDGTVCYDDVLSFIAGSRFIDLETFDHIPIASDTLILQVLVNGFDEVSGRSIVPEAADTDWMTATRFSTDQTYYRFSIMINDRLDSQDFYLISSVYNLTTYFDDGFYRDTVYSLTRQEVPLTDPIFDFMPDYRTSVQEPFSLESIKPRIFPDEVFKDDTYAIRIEVPLRSDNGITNPHYTYRSTFDAELYAISSDLFEYLKTAYIAKVVEGDIYAQPVTLKSNMSNSIGCFGAISKPSPERWQLEDNDVLKLDTFR